METTTLEPPEQIANDAEQLRIYLMIPEGESRNTYAEYFLARTALQQA